MPENEAWEYSLYIPNDLRAVTISRRTLRLILTMHGLISLVDVAELLAAELVSNAVRHTKGPAALRVRWSPPGTLRIWGVGRGPRTTRAARALRAGDRVGGRARARTGAGLLRPVGVAAVVEIRQPGEVRVVRAGGRVTVGSSRAAPHGARILDLNFG